ncbi:CDP-glycerol glycerophosphotransferase family protein [Salipaludibacillus daqingensis]|uniref:CDP-glycerol glycerophosphotransferase family protein n=1 Tax=Salipaludibacillus daqingensis TaxID=3041001 RepID=UPI0024745ECC|nr:CDP-glycerol glycerophosphotransferase family protein [Salipaludibacillus daqingensis]
MKKMKYFIHALKFFVAYILAKTYYRPLYKQNIWLIGEKKTEARDNGYHFFKYTRKNHPDINAYYVITKDSPDVSKIIKYGNVIYCYSMKHYIFFLTAKNYINSQSNNSAFPFWLNLVEKFPFLLNKQQKHILLKHGIEKDYKGPKYHFNKTGFSIISCAAEKERESIIKEYGYPEKNALLLGFCRFDKLHENEKNLKKQIIVMPTFRKWLSASDVTKEAKKSEKETFKKSMFYQAYVDFMNRDHLAKLLADFDYELIFYPHYSIQSYIPLFREEVENTRIIVADRFKYDVQELLMNSSVMITDFSSVFFDFAYMKKPQIFFQFDQKDYRTKHYHSGYFSYEKDGFGPVVNGIEKLLEELEKVLLNEAKMEAKYLRRTSEFFTLRDNDNCKRTFEAIKTLS